jgi:hypothetical protein
MEVPDGDNYADIIPSPQGNEEEVESRHYGNIVHHHESLKRPMKPRNVGLKKHPTDSEIGDRQKALSCDNLCDQEEATPQIAKSQSLEIFGKPLKAQQLQQQPVEEQLYEDVDMVMPRRDLPASGTQLKYDYISTSLVDWRGSMETLSNHERKVAKVSKVIKPHGQSATGQESCNDEITLSTPQDLSASFTQHEGKEQSLSEEDAPLLAYNSGYEIFELDTEPMKRGKVKPRPPVKPSSLTMKNSKQHSHGDSNVSDSQGDGAMDRSNVASSSTPPDKVEIEYGNIEAQRTDISSLERCGVETAPIYEEVTSGHRGK